MVADLKRLILLLAIGLGLVRLPLEVFGGVAPAQSQSASTHAAKGDQHFLNQEYTLAIQEYQSALAEDLDTTLVRLRLGLALVRNGETQKALQEWEYLVSHAEPTLQNADVLIQAYYNIGVANTKQGRYQAAISPFKQVITLGQSIPSPSVAMVGDAYFSLGVAYSGLEQWRESADAFEKAKQWHRERPQLYAALSHAYLELNDWPNAEEAAKQSVELDPFDPDNHHLLGLAYCAQGKKALAEQEMAKLYRMGVSPSDLQGTIQHFCNGN